jgi:hypothetical protein
MIRPIECEVIFARALIWLTVVKRKKKFLPTVFQRSLSGSYSKAPKGAEPVLRRLITLIFAGWLPHDLASSRSCLGLRSGVRPYGLSNRALEGSPGRGCAPVAALERCSIRSLNVLRYFVANCSLIFCLWLFVCRCFNFVCDGPHKAT